MASAFAVSVGLGIRAWAQAPAIVKGPAELGDRTGRYKTCDMAPDFSLKVMRERTRLTLSSFRNQRPVALIFGSYT